MASVSVEQKFPCPICMKPREVRTTKKSKPYLTCDPCGVQLFIRGPAGIEEFHRLLEGSMRQDVLSRLQEMDQRYRLTCPDCGSQFWIEPRLVKTSVFDGSLQGFRCPQRTAEGSSSGRGRREDHRCWGNRHSRCGPCGRTVVVRTFLERKAQPP